MLEVKRDLETQSLFAQGSMPIRKQEFYEGAALHLLARQGAIERLRYELPQFIVNESLRLHIKYSTKNRSPWGFTFVPDERQLLVARAHTGTIGVGLTRRPRIRWAGVRSKSMAKWDHSSVGGAW
jgi:hypothetical protein